MHKIVIVLFSEVKLTLTKIMHTLLPYWNASTDAPRGGNVVHVELRKKILINEL